MQDRVRNAVRLVASSLIASILMVAPATADAEDPKGDWQGTLMMGATKLRLAVHVRPAPAGGLQGTIDSLDQGTNGMALADVAAEPDTLSFTVPVIAGSYFGHWDQASSSWIGTWSQAGMALPLTLAAGGPPSAPAAQPPALPADWAIPSDAAIGSILDERIRLRAGEGIVVGIVDGSGRRVVARGPAAAAPFDGTTEFEIGSMTKVFTGLLLAEAVARGEVRLDDPADQYMPDGATLPERGRKITLLDLATHRSGLPRLPGNMPARDPANPYADFTTEQMLAFLKGYALSREVGSEFEYSNLGVGLLGYILSRRAGMDYEALVRARVTGPLGMGDTAIRLTPAMRPRFAIPHDEHLRPTSTWDLPTLAGAGALRSTADDILRFLAAEIGLVATPLAAPMKAMLAQRRPGMAPRIEQAIGWMVAHTPSGDIVMHDGGTGGFRAMMAWDPLRRRGVVVLTNAAAEPSATDIALHVLIGSPVAPSPAPTPSPRERKEVALTAGDLDRLVGRYSLAPGAEIEITRETDHLAARITGQPAYPIYAAGPCDFFWKVVDAQIRFEPCGSGRPAAALLQQGGRETRAQRLP